MSDDDVSVTDIIVNWQLEWNGHSLSEIIDLYRETYRKKADFYREAFKFYDDPANRELGARGPGRRHTTRGFEVFREFFDSYGHRVRVQKSSNATVNACWVFAERNEDDPPDFEPSPHLTPSQARQLAAALLTFANENDDGT